MGYYRDCLEGNGAVSQDAVLELIQANMSDGAFALAIYTAGVSCFLWEGHFEPPCETDPGDTFDAAHLLEIRVFDRQGEFHACRGAMGEDFSWRAIRDDELRMDFHSDCLDERQYLDRDSKKSFGYKYASTNGGFFSLPVENADSLLIRNYIEYDSDGLASVVDYRIVDIVAEDDR